MTVADAEERAGAQCLVISVIAGYFLILLCWFLPKELTKDTEDDDHYTDR